MSKIESQGYISNYLVYGNKDMKRHPTIPAYLQVGPTHFLRLNYVGNELQAVMQTRVGQLSIAFTQTMEQLQARKEILEFAGIAPDETQKAIQAFTPKYIG